jgi:toxin CcdB
MARFDVYPNPDDSEHAFVPFLLDVQNNFLDIIDTKMVIPLHTSLDFPNRVRDLNPVFDIQGQTVVLNTAAMGAVPTHALRHPVTNLSAQQLNITSALDTLFGGY